MLNRCPTWTEHVQNKFRFNLILARRNKRCAVAINSAASYRDDTAAKPPSRSRTLQNNTPLTKGTDDSSSRSKSTLNLNLFFFVRMNDMVPDAAEWVTAGRGGGGGADGQLDTFPAAAARSAVRAAGGVSGHDSKFKSPPSHPHVCPP